MLLAAGMCPPLLFALGFTQQELLLGEQEPCPAIIMDWLLAEDFAPCPGLNAWALFPEGGVNAANGNAAEHLFGAGSTAWPGAACSIDPGTLCIARSARVYPVTPMGRTTITGDIMSSIHEASFTEPLQVSLVLTGLALVAVSLVRRRRKRASPDTLPLDPGGQVPKQKAKESGPKPPSLAA